MPSVSSVCRIPVSDTVHHDAWGGRCAGDAPCPGLCHSNPARTDAHWLTERVRHAIDEAVIETFRLTSFRDPDEGGSATDDSLWFLFPFLVFIVIILARRPPGCPDCGARLGVFQSRLTKTKRQWVEGGFLCQRCGCESDRSGVKVPAGVGYRRTALLRGFAMLAVAMVPAVGLGVWVLATSREPAPPRTAVASTSTESPE